MQIEIEAGIRKLGEVDPGSLVWAADDRIYVVIDSATETHQAVRRLGRLVGIFFVWEQFPYGSTKLPHNTRVSLLSVKIPKPDGRWTSDEF